METYAHSRAWLRTKSADSEQSPEPSQASKGRTVYPRHPDDVWRLVRLASQSSRAGSAGTTAENPARVPAAALRLVHGQVAHGERRGDCGGNGTSKPTICRDDRG